MNVNWADIENAMKVLTHIKGKRCNNCIFQYSLEVENRLLRKTTAADFEEQFTSVESK